jgi:hypothetical protein
VGEALVDSDRRIYCEPLCLVVEVLDRTFAVCDSRNGEVLARRPQLRSAAAVASFLNARYPIGVIPPATDTLAHQLGCESRVDRASDLR